MSTQTYFLNKVTTNTNLPGVLQSISNYIDFGDYNCSAADVVQLLKVPAGAFVIDVHIRTCRVEGGTCTGTLGDGDSATGWDASVNLNATAGTVTSSIKGTDSFAVGKLYKIADTIDLTLAQAADTAEILAVARYILIDPHDLGLLAA